MQIAAMLESDCELVKIDEAIQIGEFVVRWRGRLESDGELPDPSQDEGLLEDSGNPRASL